MLFLNGRERRSSIGVGGRRLAFRRREIGVIGEGKTWFVDQRGRGKREISVDDKTFCIGLGGRGLPELSVAGVAKSSCTGLGGG